jgi:hypothetical protein
MNRGAEEKEMEKNGEKENGLRKRLEGYAEMLHREIIHLDLILARAKACTHYHCEKDRATLNAVGDISLVLEEEVLPKLSEVRDGLQNFSL